MLHKKQQQYSSKFKHWSCQINLDGVTKMIAKFLLGTKKIFFHKSNIGLKLFTDCVYFSQKSYHICFKNLSVICLKLKS